eukprot:jgi/Botrbrau1/13394/Bobra.0082s0001.1
MCPNRPRPESPESYGSFLASILRIKRYGSFNLITSSQRAFNIPCSPSLQRVRGCCDYESYPETPSRQRFYACTNNFPRYCSVNYRCHYDAFMSESTIGSVPTPRGIAGFLGG